MQKKHTALVMVLSIVGSAVARDNLDIALVDSFQVMRECQDGVVVGKELDAMRDKFSQEIQTKAQEITKEETALKAKASTLKPELLAKESRRLDKLKRDLEEEVREKEESIKVTMQQKTEELAIKAEEGIVAIAKEKGVDAVIDKMTGRVMYAKEDKGDITRDAISFVNNKKAIAVASLKKDEKPTEASTATA